MFRRGFVLLRRPEITALLAALPSPRGLITIVGRAQTQAFVLNLTAPAPSHGHNRRSAAYPLLATRCLHERRRGSATKATMLTGNGLSFHPRVRQRAPFAHGAVWRLPRSPWKCIPPRSALSSWAMGTFPSDRPSPPVACLDQRARDEPIGQSPTQPKSMEAHSDAASRSQSLSAPAACSGPTRARARPPSAPSGPGSPAPT